MPPYRYCPKVLVIASQSILGTYGEEDLPPDAYGAIGEGSDLHEMFGFYGQGAIVAPAVLAKGPVSLGRRWQQALQWVVANDAPEEFEIRPARDRLPGLLFVSLPEDELPEDKSVKNRHPLDFRLKTGMLWTIGTAGVAPDVRPERQLGPDGILTCDV